VKVLLDTNVVLDLLLAREPHADGAARLFGLIDRGRLRGTLCATTLTTIHYLATKAAGHRQARAHVRSLLTLFEIAPVDRTVLGQALELDFADFEDAVLHEAARLSGAAAIVTRNGKDFRGAALPVLSPQELLSGLAASEG
jgi:predicted nucleic acid-binding protein